LGGDCAFEDDAVIRFFGGSFDLFDFFAYLQRRDNLVDISVG